MKFLIASAIALMMAMTTYFVNKYGGQKTQSSSANAPVEYQVSEAKRHQAEPETKVRPDRFEAMKWTPTPDLRSPASKK